VKNASNSPPSEKVLTASGNNPEHKNIGRRVEGIDNEVFVPIMPIPLHGEAAERKEISSLLDRYGVVG
jgi:hypothetical protein